MLTCCYSVVTLSNMKLVIRSIRASSSPQAIRLPKTWPHVIRNGDVAVKIYKNNGHVRGENFPTFVLSYYANGKRQLRRFVDFGKASAESHAHRGAKGARRAWRCGNECHGARVIGTSPCVAGQNRRRRQRLRLAVGGNRARLRHGSRALAARCDAFRGWAILQTKAPGQYAAQIRRRSRC